MEITPSLLNLAAARCKRQAGDEEVLSLDVIDSISAR